MSLLIFGTTAFDTIETVHGTVERVLGGSAMHAAWAARLFGPVRVLSAVGHDFPADWREALSRAGIDLTGLRTIADVKTQYWRGRYSADGSTREHLEVDLDIFDRLDPTPPPSYEDSRFVFLGHHQPSFQLRCLDRLHPRFVLADTIDYWIQHHRADLDRLIRRIDGLIVNDAESRLLTDEQNLLRAGERLLAGGLRWVIIKKGEHGALLFENGTITALPAYPTMDVIDPTGAGDAFAGGLMGYLANGGTDPHRALAYGMILASFAVEDFGCARLQRLDRAAVEERFQRYRAMLTI